MKRNAVPKKKNSQRRGFVILSVFVIVTLALLIVTGILYLSQAEAMSRNRTASRAQSSAVAWSAVQVVMDELNAQRDAILDGNQPQIDSQYELFESDGRTSIARILPMSSTGERLIPEAGKLDLNEIDVETLIASGFVNENEANRIIEYRDGQPGQMYQSVAELCHVSGITPRRVFGEADRLMATDRAQHPSDATVESGATADMEQPLIDVFTVLAVEPALQRNGRQRINLNTPWSDELGKRVDERFGEGTSQILKRLSEQVTFDDDSKIVSTMLAFQTPIDDWPDIVDALTTESGDYHFGRVDINSASATVLATLPGIEPEQAEQIVQMREGLTADERATIVWPALQNILEPEAYEDLAGRITTRSWTYRLRVAAGTADSEDLNGPLDGLIIYELVIDLSSPAPRVAYWRDITLLQTAAILAAEAGAPADDALSEIDANNRDESNSNDAGDDDSADMNVDDDMPASDEGDPLRGESILGGDESEAAGDEQPGRRRIGRWLGGG